MNEITTYSNTEFGEIRTIKVNSEVYFVGKDIAEALGYVNPQKAIKDHTDEEDRTVNESFTVNGTMGVLINESGLYSLIMSSRLPKAKEFKRWVTADILPSIRKHGAYMTDETLHKALTEPRTRYGAPLYRRFWHNLINLYYFARARLNRRSVRPA